MASYYHNVLGVLGGGGHASMCSNCQSFRIRVRHDITIIKIPCMNCGGGGHKST